jgi:WD40-like Beta Propeller Repeat
MKMSIEAGAAMTLINRGESLGPRYSPDGKQIAFSPDPNKIAVVSATGGPFLRTFDVAPGGTLNYSDHSLLHWSADGQALTYPLVLGDEMNLWSQPFGRPTSADHAFQ